jgi:rubrerythrin
MATTSDNLKEAFAGESQAYQRYKAFAKKAEKEGLKNIALLFNTTAEAERIHAEGHFQSQDGIGSTVENLKAAIGGETYEHTTMYPPMLQQAIADQHKAKRMFGYAVKVEEIHAQLYAKALEAAQQGKDLDVSEIYLCPVCGCIEFGKPTFPCPVCGLPAEKFVKL